MSLKSILRKDFGVLKKEAKKLIENKEVDIEELKASIRKTRMMLAKKGKIKYREEVTINDMCVALANRKMREK